MSERAAQDGPPAPSPTILIMSMGRKLRAEVERELGTSGLTLRHLSALGHLGRAPGLSYSELARRAGAGLAVPVLGMMTAASMASCPSRG